MSTERTQSELYEMVVRGTNFRDDFEFELYGEEVTAILRPLVDDEFLPVAALISEKLDLDVEDNDEAVSEAIDKVEESKDEAGEIDITQLDDEFVAIMQSAAIDGLHGSYQDGEAVEHSEEEKEFIVSNMMGGASVELGGRVLEISGDVRDAEKFRGGRGRVDSSRAE